MLARIYVFTICVVAAVLFLIVDKFEPVGSPLCSSS